MSSQLKLSLRCDKRVPAILAFLRKRWEGYDTPHLCRIPGIDHMRLFPTQDHRRIREFDVGWGWDNVDLTVAKIYNQLGCPERFELEYGWPLPGTQVHSDLPAAAATGSHPTMLAYSHGREVFSNGYFSSSSGASAFGAHATLPSLQEDADGGLHDNGRTDNDLGAGVSVIASSSSGNSGSSNRKSNSTASGNVGSRSGEGSSGNLLGQALLRAWPSSFAGAMGMPPVGFSDLEDDSDFPPLDDPRPPRKAASQVMGPSSISPSSSGRDVDGGAAGLAEHEDMDALMSAFPVVASGSNLFAAPHDFFGSEDAPDGASGRADSTAFGEQLSFAGSGHVSGGASSTSQHILAMEVSPGGGGGGGRGGREREEREKRERRKKEGTLTLIPITRTQSLSTSDLFEGFMVSQSMSSLPALGGFPLKM